MSTLYMIFFLQRSSWTNLGLKVLLEEWGHVPFPITCYCSCIWSSLSSHCASDYLSFARRFCQPPVKFLSWYKWMLCADLKALRERFERIRTRCVWDSTWGCTKLPHHSPIARGRKQLQLGLLGNGALLSLKRRFDPLVWGFGAPKERLQNTVRCNSNWAVTGTFHQA